MVDTPKTDHWQEVVLTPTGVTPGTFNLAQVTVGLDGRITNISSGTVATISAVATVADLPTIPVPTDGQIAVVLDDGSDNEQIYIWNSANPDVGAPLNKWVLTASTDTVDASFGFKQSAIALPAVQNIGSAIPDNGIIKEISVQITTPYTAATTIEIQDAAAFVYMPTTDINPELAATYTIDLSGNLNDMQANSGAGQGQMRAVITGAPAAGAGAVFITYVNA